jgi:hypothetical protein
MAVSEREADRALNRKPVSLVLQREPEHQEAMCRPLLTKSTNEKNNSKNSFIPFRKKAIPTDPKG